MKACWENKILLPYRRYVVTAYDQSERSGIQLGNQSCNEREGKEEEGEREEETYRFSSLRGSWCKCDCGSRACGTFRAAPTTGAWRWLHLLFLAWTLKEPSVYWWGSNGVSISITVRHGLPRSLTVVSTYREYRLELKKCRPGCVALTTALFQTWQALSTLLAIFTTMARSK